MLRRLLPLLGALVSLAACAPHEWVNGNPAADLGHDQAVCRYQADAATPEPENLGDAVANAIRIDMLESECMTAAGWAWVSMPNN